MGNPLELGVNEEQMMEELEGLLRQKSFTRAAEKALHLGDKFEKMGEKEKALRLKNQAVDFLLKARNQHIERKSWKHVANASFHAAKLLEELERSGEVLPLIESGTAYLSKAAEEYLVWQDLEKATMCFIAFILLKIGSEDFEVEREVENYRSRIGISELSHPKENSMLAIPRILIESIEKTDNELLSDLNWDLLKEHYFIHSYKIQMRYSLALLMILAFGGFQRMGLKINTGVSHKLLLFWTLLSKEVKSRSAAHPSSLWNIYLEDMPHWSKIDEKFIEKLNEDNIELLIHNSRQEFDRNNEEFNLFLDFSVSSSISGR